MTWSGKIITVCPPSEQGIVSTCRSRATTESGTDTAVTITRVLLGFACGDKDGWVSPAMGNGGKMSTLSAPNLVLGRRERFVGGDDVIRQLQWAWGHGKLRK